MLEHNDFQKNLQTEISELAKLSTQLTSQLENPPVGTLNIMPRKKGYLQYVQRIPDGRRKYIPVSQKSLAAALAQKSYDENALLLVEKRMAAAESLLSTYHTGLDDLFKDLSPQRQSLVTPILPSDQSFIDAWYKNHPGNMNSYPLTSTILSERGEQVRSKSEKILADYFYRHGIPYVYEAQLLLPNRQILCPDFLLLNVRLRKTYIYEYFGLMDDPEYAKKACKKISTYEKNGYWPGDTLLFEFETSEQFLDTRKLEEMINRFLI